jgi:hypothetical protein
VQVDREEDLFYFALKESKEEELPLLNSKGRVVGSVEYDLGFQRKARRKGNGTN